MAEEINETGMVDPGEDFNLIFRGIIAGVVGSPIGNGGLGFLHGGDELAVGEIEVSSVDAAMAALAEKVGLGEAISGRMEIRVGELDDLGFLGLGSFGEFEVV